jgi:hypothetical protein
MSDMRGNEDATTAVVEQKKEGKEVGNRFGQAYFSRKGDEWCSMAQRTERDERLK